MTSPAISVQEVRNRATNNSIPTLVFDIINNLISVGYDEREDAIVVYATSLQHNFSMYGINYIEALRKGWLDFESEYRKQGWVVEYHKRFYPDGDTAWVFKPQSI